MTFFYLTWSKRYRAIPVQCKAYVCPDRATFDIAIATMQVYYRETAAYKPIPTRCVMRVYGRDVKWKQHHQMVWPLPVER